MKCYVNFGYSTFVDIQYTLSIILSCPKADLDVHTNTSFQSASASANNIHMSAKVCMYVYIIGYSPSGLFRTNGNRQCKLIFK